MFAERERLEAKFLFNNNDMLSIDIGEMLKYFLDKKKLTHPTFGNYLQKSL